MVGLINYPRFPSTPEKILEHALAIAKLLLDAYKQYKVSVICSDKTYMLEQGIDLENTMLGCLILMFGFGFLFVMWMCE